mgnify:CR=1 FL=1
MAIVINGSGTVTGLAVGGLPDGTVDAGTLATNSVDSAELIDGSIDTAHIAANQITSAIMPAGSVLQVVYAQDLTVKTTTTAIPHNDTIPQNDEGVEVVSLAITPTSSSSKLVFIATGVCASTVSQNQYIIALYQDSTSNALACVSCRGTAQTHNEQNLTLNYHMTAGTTSATTFKIRLGTGGGTLTTNGKQGGRFFGGVQTTALTIMEIAV